MLTLTVTLFKLFEYLCHVLMRLLLTGWLSLNSFFSFLLVGDKVSQRLKLVLAVKDIFFARLTSSTELVLRKLFPLALTRRVIRNFVLLVLAVSFCQLLGLVELLHFILEDMLDYRKVQLASQLGALLL